MYLLTLSVDNIQQNTADLNWDEVPDAANGYEWYVFAAGDDPQNDTPVANCNYKLWNNFCICNWLNG